MPFHLVRLDDDGETVLLGNDGEPWVINSAQEAQMLARDYTHYHGVKHQPRPVKQDIDWRARELGRFESGHYTKLPWHNEAWVSKVKECADHFAHVSRTDPTKLAFVPNEVKAMMDIHTQMRPSKYLANYYNKVLTEDEIRKNVAGYKKLYDKGNTLSFAYTGKEILRVYRKGPQSCMSYPLDSFRTSIHPVTVYEGPDLAIAYVERDGRVVGRTVCWPDKKLYTRIYGDQYLMQNLLEEEGYVRGSLAGARMTKVKQGNRYVCPFIDGVKRVKVGRKYLHIHPEGRRSAVKTDGFCGEGFRCAFCATEQDAEKAEPLMVNGRQDVCTPCYDRELAAGNIAKCQKDERMYRRDRLVEMFDGQLWHRQYAADQMHGFECDTCHRYYPAQPRYMTPRKSYYDPYRCRDCGIPQRELPLPEPSRMHA